MNKPIGIFGGTFDPIHYGHLKPAQQILQRLKLAEIKLLPSHKPPHKSGTNATSEQRADMVTLASQQLSGFTVDLRELNRVDPSYTVVTLKDIRQQYPDNPLCFLMGMDSLLSLKSWYQWQQLLTLCHLVVSYRPGWTLDDSANIHDILKKHQTNDIKDLHQQPNGCIYLAAIDELAISASQIRNEIKAGQSIKHFVPESVYDYIERNRLYL